MGNIDGQINNVILENIFSYMLISLDLNVCLDTSVMTTAVTTATAFESKTPFGLNSFKTLSIPHHDKILKDSIKKILTSFRRHTC